MTSAASLCSLWTQGRPMMWWIAGSFIIFFFVHAVRCGNFHVPRSLCQCTHIYNSRLGQGLFLLLTFETVDGVQNNVFNAVMSESLSCLVPTTILYNNWAAELVRSITELSLYYNCILLFLFSVWYLYCVVPLWSVTNITRPATTWALLHIDFQESWLTKKEEITVNSECVTCLGPVLIRFTYYIITWLESGMILDSCYPRFVFFSCPSTVLVWVMCFSALSAL